MLEEETPPPVGSLGRPPHSAVSPISPNFPPATAPSAQRWPTAQRGHVEIVRVPQRRRHGRVAISASVALADPLSPTNSVSVRRKREMTSDGH